MTGNTRNKLQVPRHSQCGPVSGSGSGDSSDVWGKAGDSCGDGARVSWPSSPRCLAQLLAPAILSISASHRQLVAGGQPVLCVICDSRDPCTHPVWHRGHDTCHHQPRVFSRQVRHVPMVDMRGLCWHQAVATGWIIVRVSPAPEPGQHLHLMQFEYFLTMTVFRVSARPPA